MEDGVSLVVFEVSLRPSRDGDQFLAAHRGLRHRHTHDLVAGRANLPDVASSVYEYFPPWPVFVSTATPSPQPTAVSPPIINENRNPSPAA